VVDRVFVSDRQGIDDLPNAVRLFGIQAVAIQVLQIGHHHLPGFVQLALGILALGEFRVPQAVDQPGPALAIELLMLGPAHEGVFDFRTRRRQLPGGMQKLQNRNQMAADDLGLGDPQMPKTLRAPGAPRALLCNYQQ
jgi:hypothetical protein